MKFEDLALQFVQDGQSSIGYLNALAADLKDAFRGSSTQQIAAVSVVVLAAAVCVIAVLVWRQSAVLIESERRRWFNQIANEIYGPVLLALQELRNPESHFDPSVLFQIKAHRSWPWKELKLSSPYLALQVPRPLFEAFDIFSQVHEQYQASKTIALPILTESLRREEGLGEANAIHFESEEGLPLKQVPLEFFVCQGGISDYQKRLRKQFHLRKDPLMRLVGGEVPEGIAQKKLDETLFKIRESVQSQKEVEKMLRLQGVLLDQAGELEHSIQRLLRDQE